MESIKKIFGIVWIALGIYAAYYLLGNYWKDVLSEKPDDKIRGIVFVFVLVPIIAGALVRFGLFALSGAYNDDDA